LAKAPASGVWIGNEMKRYGTRSGISCIGYLLISQVGYET
jgi:hypothetical protein